MLTQTKRGLGPFLFGEIKVSETRYLSMKLKKIDYTYSNLVSFSKEELPRTVMFLDNVGEEHIFVFIRSEHKYFLKVAGTIMKGIFFDITEDSQSVEIANIDLKELSNKSLGSQIISFAKRYSDKKGKLFQIALCFNGWLIKYLQKEFPNSIIDSYDFKTKIQKSGNISQTSLVELTNEFRVRIDGIDNIFVFDYNKEVSNSTGSYFESVVNGLRLEISLAQEVRLYDVRKGVQIVDFQLYLYNVLCNITCFL